MDDLRYQCALWLDHGYIGYDLFETEDGAAKHAAWMYWNSDSAALGVQFSDGRALALADWPAYQAAYVEAKADHDEQERLRREAPPRAVRKIRDPFTGWGMVVDVTEPAWIGRQEDQP